MPISPQTQLPDEGVYDLDLTYENDNPAGATKRCKVYSRFENGQQVIYNPRTGSGRVQLSVRQVEKIGRQYLTLIREVEPAQVSINRPPVVEVEVEAEVEAASATTVVEPPSIPVEQLLSLAPEPAAASSIPSVI